MVAMEGRLQQAASAASADGAACGAAHAAVVTADAQGGLQEGVAAVRAVDQAREAQLQEVRALAQEVKLPMRVCVCEHGLSCMDVLCLEAADYTQVKLPSAPWLVVLPPAVTRAPHLVLEVCPLHQR